MSAPPVIGAVSQREFARLERCDEKQVRRGVASGKLIADASGKLDRAQVGSGWRKPRVDSKESGAAKVPSAAADSAKNVRVPPSEASVAGVPTVMSAEGASLKRAVAHKEDFAGRLKELEYRQKAGELIEVDLARKVIFDESRAARDAWLNWPVKSAALMAAELGIDADRLAGVLTTYVHKQVAALGEPSGQFRKG